MGQPLLPPAPVIYLVEPFGGSIRRQNPNMPHVFWDDAAVTRGDGIFETILVRGGKPANLKRHLARFRRSARALGLPEPGEHWLTATREAVEDFCRERSLDDVSLANLEATCVWTLTRGRETTGVPTAWLTVRPIAEKVLRQRAEGVSVVTTPRGYTATADVPWMAAEAKTLNYAASMAALRWAAGEGYDDVIYTARGDAGGGDTGAGNDRDEDVRVLEGATSSVVMVKKGKRLRSPKPGPGILAGTTQAALFAHAEDKGWKCKEKDIYLGELFKAESVWLVSSTRVCARVTSINGTELAAPKPSDEAEIRDLIAEALAQ